MKIISVTEVRFLPLSFLKNASFFHAIERHNQDPEVRGQTSEVWGQRSEI